MSEWAVVWVMLGTIYFLIYILIERVRHVHRHVIRIEGIVVGMAMVQSGQLQGVPDEAIRAAMKRGMERAEEEMKFMEIAEREKPPWYRRWFRRV